MKGIRDMAGLSVAMQNYLETIFALAKKSDGVRVSDIASQLDVSKASVNNAMNVLAKMGYVSNEKYQEIYLTEQGKEIGAILEVKHSIVKTLFTDVLGISEEVADDDACAIEHIISHEAIQSIHRYLKVQGKEVKKSQHSD